ncbi:unnamed protein product [Prunus armeniaca]|uniref:Uncharacterized protein n=1 Tax=Prunus armeniaca TaxID=36596 RepID=A0A6J5XTS5_PRUAR|nr:unnamed protein product [Prunus armeniaca]
MDFKVNKPTSQSVKQAHNFHNVHSLNPTYTLALEFPLGHLCCARDEVVLQSYVQDGSQDIPSAGGKNLYSSKTCSQKSRSKAETLN